MKNYNRIGTSKSKKIKNLIRIGKILLFIGILLYLLIMIILYEKSFKPKIFTLDGCNGGYCYYINMDNLKRIKINDLNDFDAINNRLLDLKNIGVKVIFIESELLKSKYLDLYSDDFKNLINKAKKLDINIMCYIYETNIEYQIYLFDIGFIGFIYKISTI